MSVSGGPNLSEDGLVLYLDTVNNKSYAGSGITWSDLSGNNNSGSLINGPTFNSANGGSIVFDGSNDHVLVSTSGSLGANFANGVSLSVWCKTTTTETLKSVLGVINTGTSMNFGINLNNGITADGAVVGATQFVLRNNSTQIIAFISASTSQTIYDGVWHNLTWTFSPATSTAFAYVDSVSAPFTLINTWVAGTGGFVNFDRPMAIGARNNRGTIERFANIEIGNVYIYDRVLSANEVLQNFNSQRSRFGV